MEYILQILILIGIYIILSVSLNLIAGYTGMISIAHAAFYGVGAYATALIAIQLHSPFLVNVLCAFIIGGLFGALVSLPSLRMRDDYLVIATFAFQVIVFNILNNWDAFTGGPVGLPSIPKLTLLGFNLSSHIGLLGLVACFCVIVFTLIHRIVNSPFGRVLKAIREDEVLARADGKNVVANKVTVFIIGAGMASMAGSLYAYYIGSVDPTGFTVMESIFIISIVIIGGAGSERGPVLGAIALVLLPELFRFIGLPNSIAANMRQILYGGLLVAFMIWRPSGFLGKFSFYTKGSANE